MVYETSDEIVDQIWHDLGERVSRPHVAEVAKRVAADLGDVKIAIFLPLFVRRLSVDRLRSEALQRGA